jgi:hypothetical protein
MSFDGWATRSVAAVACGNLTQVLRTGGDGVATNQAGAATSTSALAPPDQRRPHQDSDTYLPKLLDAAPDEPPPAYEHRSSAQQL